MLLGRTAGVAPNIANDGFWCVDVEGTVNDPSGDLGRGGQIMPPTHDEGYATELFSTRGSAAK